MQILLDDKAFQGCEVVSGACKDSMLPVARPTLYCLIFIEDMAGAVLQKTVILLVLFADTPQCISEILVGELVYY